MKKFLLPIFSTLFLCAFLCACSGQKMSDIATSSPAVSGKSEPTGAVSSRMPADLSASASPLPPDALSPSAPSPDAGRIISEITAGTEAKAGLPTLEAVKPIFYYDFANSLPDSYKKFPNTASANFSDDAERKAFVQYYLKMHLIAKEQPDGVSYVNEKVCTEYYIDHDSQKICFIIYESTAELLADSLNEHIKLVTCIAVTFNDLLPDGYIAYADDHAQGIAAETLFDATGKRVAGVSYQYRPDFPFPIITAYDVLDEEDYEGYENRRNLISNQRFLLYADFIKYDSAGKPAGYDGCVSEAYIYKQHDLDRYRKEHGSRFSYDENGRLTEIREIPATPQFDWQHWEGLHDYSGLIEIKYQESGLPLLVEHSFFPNTHHRGDDSGQAVYDREGRMVYRNHYKTSGANNFAWFYEGDSKSPWACVRWGSIHYSGIRDLSDYTDSADVPDWILESAAKGFFYEYGGGDTTVRIFKDVKSNAP